MELSKLMGCIKRPFIPSELFRGGLIDGAWFDPSDLSTLYQDAAGTTPVTAVEQPVGLVLDKSQGRELGPELVTNGDFSNGAAMWTTVAGTTISGGKLIATNATDAVRQTISGFVVGKTYKITFTIDSISSGKARCVFGGSTSPYFTQAGTYTVYQQSSSGDPTLYLGFGGVPTSGVFDNVSVRELYGYHATQSITASRPTLSARYNLLTKTEDFSAAAWVVSGCSAVKNYGVSPIGTITSSLLTNSAVGGYLTQADGVVGANKTLTAYIKNSSTGWVRIAIASLAVGKNGAGYFINTTTGAKGSVFTGGTGYSVVSCASEMQADGWVKVVLTVAGAREVQQPVLNIAQSDGNFSGPIGATVQLWGVDQRLGTTSGPYQRVNTATDYDTDERYFKKYLRFDGVDDYLVLPYMGLYGGGAASIVCARDAVSQATDTYIISERSTTDADPKYFPSRQLASAGNMDTYITDDAGAVVLDTVGSPFSGVANAVIRSIVDSGNNLKLFKNGVLAANDNYTRSGTLTLNNTTIGASVSTTASNYASMKLYGLIITKSALTDAQRIACERYLGRKSGVQL